MRRYLIIPGALLAFILFSAKSCKDDPGVSLHYEEEALNSFMDSVKDGFSASYLDEESLFVFTRNAKQKLVDYSDFMNISNDSSLDSVFRSQAMVMVQSLFGEGLSPARVSPGRVTYIDSIWLIEPLHLAGDGLYKGELGFREEAVIISGEDTVTSNAAIKKLEFLATKSKKVIGTDTLIAWQVCLGEIYLLQTP